MGYYTRVTGEIRVTPPITWAEAKDTTWAQQGSGHYDRDFEFVLHMNEQDDETVIEGELVQVVRRTFTRVEPRWDDSYKAYYSKENLQQLVDAFPGHEWIGYLEGEGEGAGDGPDIWRLYVRDGKVIEVRPELVWPEV